MQAENVGGEVGKLALRERNCRHRVLRQHNGPLPSSALLGIGIALSLAVALELPPTPCNRSPPCKMSYSLLTRDWEAGVLPTCEELGIGFNGRRLIEIEHGDRSESESRSW